MKEKLTVKETDEIINKKDVDEQEIKQAISDIMKSLSIKEEEKEDDNMNNGNFFPNFDNNNSMNNNASLNMMNMQSMNQAPMEAAPEMVMPTVNVPVQEPVAPQMPEQPMMQPQFDTNMNNSFNPMAGFMAPPEVSVQPAMNHVEPPVAEAVEKDKLTQLQELLTNNGFEFKSFSNDTTNCIIIELPRN